MKELIVICGATASGKTSLGIRAAKQFGTEIISADSRQFYKEMNIGTAKPTPNELAQAKHHFINSLSIQQDYNAGNFETEALALLEQLFKTHNKVICVGGSGLYIKALCEGFDDLPKATPKLREQLNQELEQNGIETLLKELETKDPIYAEQVHKQNPRRVLRALEVIRTSGQPFSSFRTQTTKQRPFSIKKYGINWDREHLYDRINLRVNLMLEEGLEEEVKSLYPFKHLNSLQTVGYQEFFNYFDGNISKEEAFRLIKRNSRRYAKRQLTWFRKDETITWIKPEMLENFEF